MAVAATPHLASVYGVNLSSCRPLPDLPPARANDIELQVTVNSNAAPVDGTRLWAPSGLHCVAALQPSPRLWFDSDCSDVERVNWLCSSFVPALLASSGALVLRGAAVRSPTGAVLVLGSAMSGRSSFAALMATVGWPLISDDVVVLRRNGNQLCVFPGAPWIKLWPGMRALGNRMGAVMGETRDGISKARFGLNDQSGQSAAVPVVRVCVLRGEPEQAPTFTPIAATGLLEIVGMLQRPPASPPSAAAMGEQFAALCGLARLPNPGWVNPVNAASSSPESLRELFEVIVEP